MDRGANDLSLQVALSYVDRGASAGLRGFGSVLAGLGGPLGVVGAGVAAFGAISVAAIAKSVQMAAQYQQQMNMVQALTGASNDQMAQYDAGLKNLAIDAGVAPAKLAAGLYQIISSGAQGKQAMLELTLATQDSKIGMTDAATTADALTNVLANFSFETKDATRVNGEMLETVTLGKSTFQQYASTITKAASTSAQFKISLETTSAAWATMTANGISAGKASTDYVQLVQAMDGKIQTIAKSLKKNGIAFDETKFNAESFGQKVQTLNQVLQEAAKKHVSITGVTLQAAQAITVISGHIGVYNSDLAALSNKHDMATKTASAWAITQSGLTQQMSRAGAALQVFMIDLGEKLLPVLTQIVQAVVPIITQFAAWVEQSGIVDTIIQVVSLSLKFLAMGFQRIWPSIQMVITLLIQFGQAIVQRVQPIIAHLVEFIRANWQNIAGIVQGIFAVVVGIIQTAWSIITGIFKIALDIIGGNWKQAWTDLKNMLGGILSGIEKMFVGVWITIVNAFKLALGGVGNFFKGVWNGVVDILKSGVNFFIGILNHLIDGYNNLPKMGIPNLPHIPTLAIGGEIPPGGVAIAGESGPEFVFGGRNGASVLGATQSAAAMRGGGTRAGGQTIQHIFAPVINLTMPGASRMVAKQTADLVKKELASQWRGNANIQVATSGSVRS